MQSLQDTVGMHQKILADLSGKVANQTEIVVNVTRELENATAQYEELNAEAKWHAKNPISRYGNSGDYC